jgi:hypothetical protein
MELILLPLWRKEYKLHFKNHPCELKKDLTLEPISTALPYITTGAVLLTTTAYSLYKYCHRHTHEALPLTGRVVATSEPITEEITINLEALKSLADLEQLAYLNEAVFSTPCNIAYIESYTHKVLGQEYKNLNKSPLELLSDEASRYVASAHHFTQEEWDRLDYFCWEACGKPELFSEFGKYHRLDLGLSCFLGQVHKVLGNMD